VGEVFQRFLRILEYPLAIGVLEMAQVICFSVAAAELRRRAAGFVPLLGLFPLFLCTFYLGNFGAGSPLIIALHLQEPSPIIVMLASTLSMIFALFLVRGAASLLPSNSRQQFVAVRHATA
jgi:hypothetical protein